MTSNSSDIQNLTWNDLSSPVESTPDVQQALIQRCLRGDESAFHLLYNQHSGMVYRLAYSLLQHREDAEEVLQDSFDYAFRKLANYDSNKSAFTTWLYRITISRCRNKRRRKWLPTFSLNQHPDHPIPDKQAISPDRFLELNDRQKVVWKALGELSFKLRETAILRYYHGLRYNEIGEILGIPPKTAESRMRLAHKALKKELEDQDILF